MPKDECRAIAPDDPENYSPVYISFGREGSVIVHGDAFGDPDVERMVVMERSQLRRLVKMLETSNPKGTDMERMISKGEFDEACEALWGELMYQDRLSRRTADEAKDVPGFLTLIRVYVRKAEDYWASRPGTGEPAQVEEALHGLRKIAAIAIRAMVYNGILQR